SHAISRGNYFHDLLRQAGFDSVHPVSREVSAIHEPLPNEVGHAGRHSVNSSAGLKPANHAQPCLEMMQERTLSGKNRLLQKRNPEIRRIAAQRFSKKSWRGNANNGERVAIK